MRVREVKIIGEYWQLSLANQQHQGLSNVSQVQNPLSLNMLI